MIDYNKLVKTSETAMLFEALMDLKEPREWKKTEYWDENIIEHNSIKSWVYELLLEMMSSSDVPFFMAYTYYKYEFSRFVMKANDKMKKRYKIALKALAEANSLISCL